MQGVDTILNVLGSVCLLLWGVRMVRTGLTRAFGATLRRAIGACSRNRFTAFAGGVVLTGVLQSSTATALLLASFAGRGLISLSIGLAVMLGANVGTTLTAQILSFPLGWVSPLMIAGGAALVSETYWVLYLFAAFLIFTGIKMFVAGDQPMDVANNPAVNFISRHMRVTRELHGQRFFVKTADPGTGRGACSCRRTGLIRRCRYCAA